jgi:type I restriction enzyme S subunit
VRAPVGAVNIADRNYCIGRGLAAIRIREIKQSLAGEVIARQSLALRRVAQGTTFEAINKENLLSLVLTLPPKSEWLQIAAILDALDTAIHETEAIIAKLKAIKQGMLHDLLTRGIDANGELRPSQSEAPQLYKESPVGWIPKEWAFAPLVSKIDFPEGQVDPRRQPYCDWVLIAPDHIESGTGRLLSTATAVEQQAISGKYVFEAGDVIYSKIRPYLRKAVLASSSGLCSADMYPLRPKAGISSIYLLAVVLGDQFSRFSESVSMRSGFPKINRSEMAEFLMGWPSPDEQAQIAQVLTEGDAKQRSAEHEHKKLTRLKAGLMDDLLTGRVRVTSLITSEGNRDG